MAVYNENIELFKCLVRVSHFTKNPEDDNKFPIEPKEIKVDTELPSVETLSDRWVAEEGDCYYYNINELK